MTRVAVAVEQNWNRVPGGTAISTNRLVSALIEDGRVDIEGFAGRHRRPPTLPLPPQLEVRTIPVPGRFLQQSWSALGRPGVDRWLGGFSVVHAPAYVMPPTAHPVVVTMHDLAFRHHPEWFTAHGVRFFERFLDRARRTAAAVIVPSATTAADCCDAGIDSDRVHIVPWGVESIPVESSQAEATRASLGLSPSAVLYVGTLEPRKNLDGLARAMRRLPDLELVVAGPTGWGDVAAPPRARMLGMLSDREIRELMAAARVLVYPSHLEGFGLPVLEAMSGGTPVVVTAGTAPADVAGAGGLAVDTTDEAVLAEAIRSVVVDDALHGRLSEAARLRAAEFTWHATAAATIDVYEAVTAP